MKIAVYAIAKNEANHVLRFMKSAAEADCVVVLDTGSTDDTVKLLQSQGAIVHEKEIKPWRFDVARNLCLHLVPQDIDVCVCMDLDEVLTEGWCEALKKEWKDIDRMRCMYAWSHKPDGTPDRTLLIERIHTRENYEWRHAVHEYLYWIGEGEERQGWTDSIKMDHWPDGKKSRAFYLNLLETVAKEEPDNDRNAHYLGREYMFREMWDKAIAELKRHLSLPSATWDQERCASCRFIARSYAGKGDYENQIKWLFNATFECPNTLREPWIELAQAAFNHKDYLLAYYAARKCLEIVVRVNTYITESEPWGAWPHDLLACAAAEIGEKRTALEHGEIAAKLNPNDERIRKNLEFFKKEIKV